MQADELPTLCLGEVRSLRVWVTRNLIQVSDRWTVPLHLKGLTLDLGPIFDPLNPFP